MDLQQHHTSGRPGSCRLFSTAGRKAATVTIIAIAVVISAFYGQFLNNYFVYDDFRYIADIFSSFKDLLFGFESTRFLSNMAFVPIFSLSGYNPLGYNLFNMLLHGLNALLLAALATRLSGSFLTGSLTGILFAGLSSIADAVLWKCACNSLLSGFFSLLAFHFYLNWRESGQRRQIAISIAMFVAAIFSKEDSAALALFIFAYELICNRQKLGSLRLAAPYIGVVVLNLVFAQTLLRIMKIPLEHYDRFLSFRPVYAAIGGYTTFLFNPTGISRPSVTTVATVTVLVCAAVIMAENRRLALLAVAGIFLFFLPSSLTSLGSLDPEYIFKSVSRYLYLPSTMGMLLLALLATAIYRRLPKSVGIPAIAILLCLFTGYNYSQVKQRGIAWRNEGIPSRAFLQEMKRVFPAFPPNSHIFVDYPPFGRSYVVHALRAVYQEPAIHWIVDPPTFKAPAGSSVFMISCDWINNESVRIAVRRF